MGSKLVGNDIRCLKGDQSFQKAQEEWRNVGRTAAKELFLKFTN